MGRIIMVRIFLYLMLISLFLNCGGSGGDSDTTIYTYDDTTIDPYDIEPSTIETFEYENGDICMEDGKPVIRMFSSPTCPHCLWSADAFEPVVQMYVDEGLIVAHHWESYTGDDLLTSQVEDEIPESEMAIYDTFSPQSLVPTFVFGCVYYRIGTGHEAADDLEAEAAEFMAVIEELLIE